MAGPGRRAAIWLMVSFAGAGLRPPPAGPSVITAEATAGRPRSNTATQLRAARNSTTITGITVHRSSWPRPGGPRARCAPGAQHERTAARLESEEQGQSEGQQQVEDRGHNVLLGKVISGSARSVLERSPAAKWNVSQ